VKLIAVNLWLGLAEIHPLADSWRWDHPQRIARGDEVYNPEAYQYE
jgi:hypothetical protein